MPCGVGGGTHRSWPGGRGGRPRALIPGEGVREGWVPTEPPQGRSKFRNVCRIFVVSNAYKKEEKWRFLKDALWGGGGYPPELVDGEVDQGPWLQERVGGGVGAMAVPKKGEGWGLVGCSKEEQVQGRGQGRVGLAVGGGAKASVPGR